MSNKRLPYIGISGICEQYAEPLASALKRNGATSVIIPVESLPDPTKMSRQLTGLIVAGCHMAHSSGNRNFQQLLHEALEFDKPVLAVGDGMQALNVMFGGTFIDDVSGHGSTHQEMAESSFHRIYISPGSKLAAIVGSGGIVRVNSRHSQGVKERQKSVHLLASAYALDDGLIEGLESPEHDWVLGVQFHPERRKEVPPHFDKLFLGLVERAQRLLD